MRSLIPARSKPRVKRRVWSSGLVDVTLGAGFKLSIFSLDVAYTIATSTNPLDQTLRFTLGFDLAGIKDLIKR